MVLDIAEARGRAMIRPWRVAVLADTSSAATVREAIADLSSVWGGRSMPIFDISSPIAELEQLGNQYDVDSLYADVVDGALGDLLRKPGWVWSGRGEWGPFGEEQGFRKGLLPTRSFIDASTNFVQPIWESDDPADLVLAATWGVADQLGLDLPRALDIRGPRAAPYAQVVPSLGSSKLIVGTLDAGSAHVSTNPRAYLDDFTGVYVVRPERPTDVVEFWNMRTYGTNIIAVPAVADQALLQLLLSTGLARAEGPRDTGSGAGHALRVWGFDDASDSTAEVIRATAADDGSTVWPEPRGSWPRYLFQGLRTPFTNSIRAEFRPGARWMDVATPVLPIEDEPDAFARGVVAAEISLHRVSGQDPRLTASLPPYRRHSSLLHDTAAVDGIDHARVTHDGLALGISADRDHVRVPFAYNQEVFRLLFDDDSLSTSQSDVGRFQSRAAEKLGGPFSGVLNQPGTRAALLLAAGRSAGVTLPHLRNVVRDHNGSWPDPLFGPRLQRADYATQQVNYLLQQGFFVPTLRVHCSHCRVESYASANDLATSMTCEFCGQDYSLALSQSLAPPEWRYRLAAHLRADQVQALLPAVATTSLLRQLRHFEEPPIPHVLGLEVLVDGRSVEVDVAAYLPDRDGVTVLGEVKSANRIDENDIANLEFLRQRLSEKGVRCLLLFATLKAHLSPEEISALRALADRSAPVTLSDGNLIPNMPMILTGPDLSHPPGSRDHPRRWDSKSFSGVFGTAVTSCERNLGLKSAGLRPADDGIEVQCDWDD